MSLRVNFEEFFLWLASHSTHESVGLPGRCFHSPLALYLSQQAGGVVGEDSRKYGRASAPAHLWLEMPWWAQLFASLSERFSCGSALSAYDAVGLLVQVETALASVPALAA